MNAFARVILGFAGVGLLGLSSAAAQSQSPLASVAQPGAGVADGAEPWAVVLNPAALGQVRDWIFGLRDSEIVAGNPLSGRGTGLYVARPLPYLSRFAIGGGLELLRPLADDQPLLTGKLTLALAYRPLSNLSLGLSYAHLFAPGASPDNGLDTVSVGARLTASRFFALGVMLHDLPAPRPASGLGVERSYEAELLLRPLGTHRFELAAGLRYGEESNALWPRVRLWAHPLPGLGIGAEGLLGVQSGVPLDYRIGVGMQIDFANVGASAFALFGNRASGGVGLHGGSVAVRASYERYPALWRGPGRLYRVDLANLDGEGMLRLLASLRSLENDSRARGVVVVVHGFSEGWGIADEIRQAMLRLRASGKRVFAYASHLSTRGMYIAAAAERVFLDPTGAVSLVGVHSGNLYIKELLDRLGIRFEVLRVSDYKAAAEPLIRTEPSEAARAQTQGLVDDQYVRLCDGVGAGRAMTQAQVAKLIDRGQFTAKAAHQAGLVDALMTGDQLAAQLPTILGETLPIAMLEREHEHPSSYAPPGVAVLLVEGSLGSGRSLQLPLLGTIAGERTLLDALNQIESDVTARALVLRVESPGGSVGASEVLTRKLQEVAKVKPVICSFGDVAGSGGYYIATPCERIFVSPSTRTGSIGVFHLRPEGSGLLDKLGVRRVAIQRGPLADFEKWDLVLRPYTETERTLVMEQVRQEYDHFLDLVQASRHLSRDEVETRAQGRVWSGTQAIALKLADSSGGLMDAVAEARKRGGLAPEGDSPLYYYPRHETSVLSRVLGLPPGLLEDGSPAAGAIESVLRFVEEYAGKDLMLIESYLPL